MKMKQVEEITGISAKNIRFYEQQQLLCPARNQENSYREYDEEDVRTLKLIKVLRKLDMPLENIRQVICGKRPLDEVVAMHISYLENSVQELEAAKRISGELVVSHTDVGTLDVDGCLSRMNQLEQQGETFADVLHDFKQVADSVERMRFRFYPRELITTPREFTEALLEYAAEQKLEIVITKECMYPEFTLDGVEYTAMRYTGRFGSVISVEAVEPDGLLPRHVPRQRRWWMEWIWRIAFPALMISLASILLLGRGCASI